MRYYDIQITPQGSTTPYKKWQSHPNGQFDPQAQNIEFDAAISTFHAPAGATTISILGPSFQDIMEANSWGFHPVSAGSSASQQGMTLTLRAGMQAGLPLANPQQAGIILSGQIVQAFGNWEGTEMSLDMVVAAESYSVDTPGNIVLNWTAGTDLKTALNNCLAIAFPNSSLTFNISNNLKLNYDVVHMASTLTDLATWLYQFTNTHMHNPVSIAPTGGSISIFDPTYVPEPIQVVFTDLIGEPVWIEPNIMQAKFVMRSDLQIGRYIQMPQGLQDVPGIALTRAASMPSQTKTSSTFPTKFYVKEVRHIGNYRSNSGADWATIINMAVVS